MILNIRPANPNLLLEKEKEKKKKTNYLVVLNIIGYVVKKQHFHKMSIIRMRIKMDERKYTKKI